MRNLKKLSLIAPMLALGCQQVFGIEDTSTRQDAGADQDASPPLSLSVLFPPPESLTDAETILVRGISDNVNDIAIRADGALISVNADSLEEWQIRVPLVIGENTLDVEANGSVFSTLHVERAESVADSNIGTGPELADPQGIVVDPVGNRALVALCGADALVAVDLATGNRTMISGNGRGTGPTFGCAVGLTLDNGGERAFMADTDVVFVVDLSSGNRAILSSDGSTGSGPALVAPFDVEMLDDQHVMVPDDSLGALVRIEVASGNRVIFSDANTGAGPSLVGPRRATLDAAQNRIIVSSSNGAYIRTVDLGSGNRMELARSNIGDGIFSDPVGVIIGPADSGALVAMHSAAGGVVNLDLSNGNRTEVSTRDTGSGPLWKAPVDLSLDPTGERVLVIDNGYSGEDPLVAVDVRTGERVIVSK